ncbi:MAG: hypothetical protein ABI584_11025 [Acidobacteriota bacterium]
MERALQDEVSELAQPLAGRKLYSPAAIAGYTLVTNLPVGYILHGLNLRARGRKRLGVSWVLFGAASLAFIYFMPPRFAALSYVVSGMGAFGAISLFQLESRPFALAVAQGAARARWWPPAIISAVAVALYCLFGWLLETVA